jgi:ABC-type sugar transport system ATPase subunit
MTTDTELLLQVEDVSKHFGGVRALRDARLDVRAGEVHAVVGENGAGKTTLINILGGIIARDAGRIAFDGRDVEFLSPGESQRAGIAIIHQELATIPALTVMENVHMGRMQSRLGIVDWRALRASTRAVLDEIGLDVSPGAAVSSLGISQRQLVEIAKALAAEARLIIMDEPNASLTDHESERLFEVIERLKQRNVGIIYVSHRIEEVLRISDRITVFRDGGYVGTVNRAEATVTGVVGMMVGRELARVQRRPPRETGEPLLEVRNLTRAAVPAIRDVSFTVHRGEIVGFAGLVGAGRSETARTIFGADRFDSGEVLLNGLPIHFKSPKDAVASRVGMVPEERKQLGLFMEMPIRFNIAMASMPQRSRRGIVDHGDQATLANEFATKLAIKLSSIDAPVSSLSGGNQQKTVLARWLAISPELLILDEPTHGVDVGAKADIYQLMQDLAAEGLGIILISSELPEILAMSDRIVVMHQGRVAGVLDGRTATENAVMELATGVAGTAA